MIYEPEKKRGIRKKFLPEPNPSRVELHSSSTLATILEQARELYFSEYQVGDKDIMLCDSSGYQIEIEDTSTWTLSTFYQNQHLSPSRFKLYTMIDISKVYAFI